MSTKKQSKRQRASRKETAYLLKSKANREALKRSIAQLGKQGRRLTPEKFERMNGE